MEARIVRFRLDLEVYGLDALSLFLYLPLGHPTESTDKGKSLPANTVEHRVYEPQR
jgi:hypothetical protein